MGDELKPGDNTPDTGTGADKAAGAAATKLDLLAQQLGAGLKQFDVLLSDISGTWKEGKPSKSNGDGNA